MAPKKQTAVTSKKSEALVSAATTAALLEVEDLAKEVAGMEVGLDQMMKQSALVTRMRGALDRPDVRVAILSFKNSPLGFKTDENDGKTGGKVVKYDWNTTRDCVIQGLMHGVYPVHNQMNIIASGMYITQNGCVYKLSADTKCKEMLLGYYTSDLDWLGYDVQNKSAKVKVKITYTIKGSPEESKEFIYPVKHDSRYGSQEQAFGKAKRKVCAWLFERVTGARVPDGDIERDLGEGEIMVESTPVVDVVDTEPSSADLRYLRTILALKVINEDTRKQYEKSIANGTITGENINKNIAGLVGYLSSKNHEIPVRPKSA